MSRKAVKLLVSLEQDICIVNSSLCSSRKLVVFLGTKVEFNQLLSSCGRWMTYFDFPSFAVITSLSWFLMAFPCSWSLCYINSKGTWSGMIIHFLFSKRVFRGFTSGRQPFPLAQQFSPLGTVARIWGRRWRSRGTLLTWRRPTARLVCGCHMVAASAEPNFSSWCIHCSYVWCTMLELPEIITQTFKLIEVAVIHHDTVCLLTPGSAVIVPNHATKTPPELGITWLSLPTSSPSNPLPLGQDVLHYSLNGEKELMIR